MMIIFIPHVPRWNTSDLETFIAVPKNLCIRNDWEYVPPHLKQFVFYFPYCIMGFAVFGNL
jgi:hypothetical protein